jgi:hypothetical protein
VMQACMLGPRPEEVARWREDDAMVRRPGAVVPVT